MCCGQHNGPLWLSCIGVESELRNISSGVVVVRCQCTIFRQHSAGFCGAPVALMYSRRADQESAFQTSAIGPAMDRSFPFPRLRSAPLPRLRRRRNFRPRLRYAESWLESMTVDGIIHVDRLQNVTVGVCWRRPSI